MTLTMPSMTIFQFSGDASTVSSSLGVIFSILPVPCSRRPVTSRG